MKPITYRRLKNGNYVGRKGKYHIGLRRRKHYVIEGFETFRSWWTAYITLNGKGVAAEGFFGSSLNTLVKAKKWVRDKFKEIESR